MKVLGSTILMASSRSLDKVEINQESLRVWAAPAQPEPPGDRLTISQKALEAYRSAPADGMTLTVDPKVFGLSPADLILILILEKVLGIKIRLPDEIEEAAKTRSKDSQLHSLKELPAVAARQATAPPGRGWGVSYDRRQVYAESEFMSFSVKGVVNTADGKQIAVEVQLNMSRQFVMRHNLSLQFGDAKIVDPLVLSYDGPAADFTDTTFRFDLDSDGASEEMPSLAAGSGFLTIDRNGDGVVNNGSELFGPSSGNGFAELKELDSDGDDWLDADDPVFDRLRIWTRDEQGKDTLIALGQKGIGAIYLGSLSAPFSVKDQDNVLQAQNTRMGIYLRESGQPGIVQQVELAVKEEK